MKKILIAFVVLSLLLAVSACSINNKTLAITLYYTNEDNSQILTETREIKAAQNQSIPMLALEELLKGPQTKGLKSTIPEGTKLLNVEVKDKIATVNLSNDFTNFPGMMAESLAVISVVNTVTGLEGIEKAHILIDGEELIAPSGSPYGPLESYDIKQINQDISNKKETITLYFPDEQGMYVVPEQREVVKSEPLEVIVIRELMRGPETPGLASPAIPEEAKLLSVQVKDEIAYVNFSKELIEKHIGGSTGEMMTIIPIVNSLTELPGIKKVQFLVEGNKEQTLAGHVIFDEPFERYEEWIKK
ncbi:GerMN domain-containing protein [Tepidanaerobacter acetatoxydans]|uniref:GerMN domain-containing protein n=1 Tax=Tepidanaerobacter acetatoxydans TaxID=499229 RepID=UPI001BD5D7C5|nr:GerMN domain-containing protein [Tepidanaerobacter acetatoxydans]